MIKIYGFRFQCSGVRLLIARHEPTAKTLKPACGAEPNP
jgi:hypothetical protein